MAIGQAATAALGVAIPGLIAFIFAVVAENKKPSDPESSPGLVYDPLTNESTCHYPEDPTIILGSLAVAFLFISAVLAVIALYFPYNGVKVAASTLWRSTSLLVFTIISLPNCRMPVSKGRSFGGAGFLALDATLFFLISLMLTGNARADYLIVEDEVDEKGPYGEVTPYPPPGVDTVDRV